MDFARKRGVISGEVIFIIPKLIFLTAVLFAVVILVKFALVSVIDVREVESNVLITRLLYSKDGISYFDKETSRVYPGIIELDKFYDLSNLNPNSLDTVSANYGISNPIIAARITLKFQGKAALAYYNKDRFDKWEPRVVPGVTGGEGSFVAFEQEKYILVKQSGKLTPGILNIYTIG